MRLSSLRRSSLFSVAGPVAIGSAITSLATDVAGWILGGGWGARYPVLVYLALTSFVFSTAAAALLRWPRVWSIGKLRARAGFWLSPLFAMSACAGALALLEGRHGSALEAALVGAGPGAMFWVPSLAVALLLFAPLLAYTGRLAGRGIASRERGEAIVGLYSAVLGAICASLGAWTQRENNVPIFAGGAAMVAGLVAVAFAALRARRRGAVLEQILEGGATELRVSRARLRRVVVREERSASALPFGKRVDVACELDADLEWEEVASKAVAATLK